MAKERQTRRQFSSDEKAAAVRQHVLEGKPVSAVCESLGIAPNLFYRWQKEMFDHAAAAFEVKTRGRQVGAGTSRLERENERLRARLAHKDNVIAEITEDYVRLKKSLGED
jgi:transposase